MKLKLNEQKIQKDIINYFKNLPSSRIDQKEGGYLANTPCCVGAHLANFLKNEESYLDGFEAWAESVGGNIAQVLLMLKQAGAGSNPGGEEEWDTPPQEVFNRLRNIEELPDLKGADLSNYCLKYADLSDTDLRGVNFESASLESVNFQGANLEEANFHNADLFGTDFRKANLEGVVLERTNLEEADLRETNLEEANLYAAIYDDDTKFPPGFDPEEAGMIY